MKSFIKMTLATLTGLLLFGVVTTFILGGIIGAMASATNRKNFFISDFFYF